MEKKEKIYAKEMMCKACKKSNKFKHLKDVYEGGWDELVCVDCGFGIKIKTFEIPN